MRQEVEKLENEKLALKAELASKSESIHRLKRTKKDENLFDF